MERPKNNLAQTSPNDAVQMIDGEDCWARQVPFWQRQLIHDVNQLGD